MQSISFFVCLSTCTTHTNPFHGLEALLHFAVFKIHIHIIIYYIIFDQLMWDIVKCFLQVQECCVHTQNVQKPANQVIWQASVRGQAARQMAKMCWAYTVQQLLLIPAHNSFVLCFLFLPTIHVFLSMEHMTYIVYTLQHTCLQQRAFPPAGSMLLLGLVEGSLLQISRRFILDL